MCRTFLTRNDNSQESRNLVAQLAFAFRQESYARFKHDSVECFLLSELLRPKTEYNKGVRIDSIQHIQSYKRVTNRLTVEQEGAAGEIRSVWRAFSRHLTGGTRNLEAPGGAGGVVQPVDSMSEATWRHHKDVYTPWITAASRTQVDRRHGNQGVTVAAVCLKILIEDCYPEEVDRAYGLKRSQSLRALKRGLDAYDDPSLLAQGDEPPDTGEERHQEARAGNPASNAPPKKDPG